MIIKLSVIQFKAYIDLCSISKVWFHISVARREGAFNARKFAQNTLDSLFENLNRKQF